MPRAQKLKVYCTPIGFHDAYVAAPSQKAALEAWGSDANLFARGIAEQVTDPKLTAAPLAQPGQVIRRLRGTAAEHVAALPADQRKAKEPKRAAKLDPPPNRAALEAAEQALSNLDEQQNEERGRLEERAAELARERREMEKRQRTERDQLEKQLDRARQSYSRAVKRWQS
jgi:hypothetical protein